MGHQGHLSENVKLIWQHIDPSTKDTRVADSVLQVTQCIDISEYNNVMCVLFRLAGTGSIQQATLYACTAVSGTGATAIVNSGSTEATGLIGTAAGSNATNGQRGAGMIVLEATASQIDSVLANADFVTVKASFATATDELGVLWILSNPRYAQSGLTSTGRGTTA